MAKPLHIHVHLPHLTKDAGAFKESDHPRNHGQFSSAPGGPGGHKSGGGQGTTSKSAIPDDIKARLAALTPRVQAQQNEGRRNEARAFSNLGPDMPGGYKIPPKSATSQPAKSPDEILQNLMNKNPNLGIKQGAPLEPHGSPGEPAHLKAGNRVFTSHRSTPGTATVIGPDPDSRHHTLVRIGNSTVSVPKSQLHATKEDAAKEF